MKKKKRIKIIIIAVLVVAVAGREASQELFITGTPRGLLPS